MIRTVLVDDEIDSILVLKELLKTHCPEVEIVGEARGVEEAVQLIEEISPELVFLDVAIDNGNAFDLLNQLGTINFQVIFATAMNDRAIDAFKYSAVDYLLKPVDGELLRKAVDRAIKRATEKNVTEHLKVLLGNYGALQVSQQKMAIPTINGFTFVHLKNILRFEADGSYTRVILEDGLQILATRQIKDYETILPEAIFYRVHHSHIINLNKVKEYQKGRGGYIIMEDGTSIEVAIRRREDFLNRLMK
jgi:two-component system LytT family response regulator